LNAPFVDRNLKIGGFHLNLHCCRHLAAKIILDQDPRAMPLVQHLLSHRNIKTTQRYYAEVNKIIAQRTYHQLLEAKRLSLKGTR
jgi:integrase